MALIVWLTVEWGGAVRVRVRRVALIVWLTVEWGGVGDIEPACGGALRRC